MRKLTRVDSWFGLTKFTHQSSEKTIKKKSKSATEKELRRSQNSPKIGVLSFEIASLMSKVVHLWHSLDEDQIFRLKHDVFQIEGVKNLISTDKCLLLTLVVSEMIDSVHSISQSIARLGAKCADPVLQRFENVFSDLIDNGTDVYGLTYGGTKMERKVKKMERLIAASSGLYHELEVLAEVEQTMKRMKIQARGSDPDRRNFGLVEFKHKVLWQRQEVNCLKENSVWNRTYDYVVRLLARSLFNIVDRIKTIFGYESVEKENDESDRMISRSQSMSSAIQVDAHKHKKKKKSKWLISTKSFNGCIAADVASAAPVISSCRMPLHKMDSILVKGNSSCKKSVFHNKRLKPPPSTLGAAALHLRYANVILLIEKLATSPSLIGSDSRDNLYCLLPNTVRAALRVRLKSYAKNLNMSFYDTSLALEWEEAMSRILDWLSPLAQNMIRWQAERNFEQQHNLGSSTSVLLVQTLYFASQEKTEAAIVELLVGLNYLWRFGREKEEKAMQDCMKGTPLINV